MVTQRRRTGDGGQRGHEGHEYQPGTAQVDRSDAALHCRNDSWTDVQPHSKQPTILVSVSRQGCGAGTCMPSLEL
jgi:hypothetical protein